MFHVKHQIQYIQFAERELIESLYLKNAQKLEDYLNQLLWWNDKINLVSRGVSRETLQKHIEHSLIVSASRLFKEASNVIDTGTGGGLPGIPLGIVNPDKKILLNDIVSKKIMACKQMVLRLGLKNITLKEGSIGNVPIEKEEIVVSKHAFKINDLVELLGEKKWKGIILLKGKHEVEREIAPVSKPLKLKVYSLDVFDDSFYDGKALVEIKQIENE